MSRRRVCGAQAVAAEVAEIDAAAAEADLRSCKKLRRAVAAERVVSLNLCRLPASRRPSVPHDG